MSRLCIPRLQPLSHFHWVTSGTYARRRWDHETDKLLFLCILLLLFFDKRFFRSFPPKISFVAYHRLLSLLSSSPVLCLDYVVWDPLSPDYPYSLHRLSHYLILVAYYLAQKGTLPPDLIICKALSIPASVFCSPGTAKISTFIFTSM